MDKSQEHDLEKRLEEGLRFHQTGDLIAARQCYNDILAFSPDHAGARHLLGVVRFAENDASGALELIESADRLRPGQPPVLRHLGIVLLAANRPAEAADKFRSALALEPDDADTAFSLGVAERRSGRIEIALPLLRAAAARFDSLASAHHELAEALELAGAGDEAGAAYRRALALEPEHAEARAGLGRLGHAAPLAEVRLCIGTPCFGGNVTDAYTISLLGLQAACFRRGIKLSFCLLHGDALITRARNSVVAEFLRDEKASHLLFIDADIGFSPEAVFRLLEADRDMVGGAYPVKTVNWQRVRPGLDPAATLDYVAELLEPGAPPPADGFARARYVGTGFLLVRRSVFERMAAHYPEIKYRRSHASADSDIDPDCLHAYFDCVIDRATGLYLSEDFTFCKRWIDMGGELWVDLRSQLKHVGRHVFVGDYAKAMDYKIEA